MCKILGTSKRRRVTGYKVVVVERPAWGRTRYYSPATGVEYVPGKRVKEPGQRGRLVPYFMADITEPWSPRYSPAMVGRTAVFVSRAGAEDLLHEISAYLAEACLPWRMDVAVVEMTVSVGRGECMLDGVYGRDIVTLGTRITRIKE